MEDAQASNKLSEFYHSIMVGVKQLEDLWRRANPVRNKSILVAAIDKRPIRKDIEIRSVSTLYMIDKELTLFAKRLWFLLFPSNPSWNSSGKLKKATHFKLMIPSHVYLYIELESVGVSIFVVEF